MRGITPIDKNNLDMWGREGVVSCPNVSGLLKFFFGLVFLFPYVGVIQGIDVQPNFLILAIVVISLLACVRSLKFELVPVIILAVTLLCCFLRYGLQYSGLDGVDVSDGSLVSLFTSCFHLTVIFFCYLVVYNNLWPKKSSFLLVSVLIYVFVGVIQLFDESFLSGLVYRGYQEMGSSGRGVRSLASEPAVFGHLIIVVSLMAVFYAARENWSVHKVSLLLVFLFISSTFLSRSFYSVFYHFLVLIYFFFLLNKKVFILIMAVTGFILASTLVVMWESDVRFFYIFRVLIENPVALYEQGAMLRVLNVPISIVGAYEFGLFGSGFAPLFGVQGVVPFFPSMPYAFEVGDRNLGGVVELYLRLGILSIPILIWYFHVLYKISKIKLLLNGRLLSLGWWFSISLFLIMFTYSSIGNPIIWIAFFLVYKGVSYKSPYVFGEFRV